jgi:hypothetical protein
LNLLNFWGAWEWRSHTAASRATLPLVPKDVTHFVGDFPGACGPTLAV